MAAAVATNVSSMQFCAAVCGGVMDVPPGVRDALGEVRDFLGRGVVDLEEGHWEVPMLPRTRAIAIASVFTESFYYCLLTLSERDW